MTIIVVSQWGTVLDYVDRVIEGEDGVITSRQIGWAYG
jgi:hypothetical protein